MKKFFIIVTMAFIANVSMAQSGGIEAVKRFGYSLNQWCNSEGKYRYREDVIKECAGKRGIDCRVNDELMKEFVLLLNLEQKDTYTLEAYLGGFQATMRNGKIRVQITDVKTITNPSDNDECFIHVFCKIKMTMPGGKEHTFNDHFYIRKIGQKISKISPYQEQKNVQTGKTEVITNTSDISYDRIANGDYNSIEVSYGYSSHYPLNIGVSTNFSYFNIGLEYGQSLSNEPLDLVKHTNFATSEISGKHFYLMATPGIFLRRASIDCGLGAVFTSYKYQSVYSSNDKKRSTFMMKPKVTFHIPIPLNYSSKNEKMYISPHIGYQYVPKYGKLNCWEVGIGVRFRFETY